MRVANVHIEYSLTLNMRIKCACFCYPALTLLTPPRKKIAGGTFDVNLPANDNCICDTIYIQPAVI